MFWNFQKQLILQVFFSNTSRTLLLVMCFEDVQKFGFFGKRDVLFPNNTWKFSKTLNTDIFLQNAFQKLLLLMQSPKVQNLSFFEKKMTSFAKISVKDFRSTIWHFLLRCRVRLPYCFGILKTIKILVCLEK